MIESPKVKQTVYYLNKNVLHKSTIQLILHRKIPLYHLADSVNIFSDKLFTSPEELFSELLLNIKG